MEFKSLWAVLVHDPKFKPNFALPFYHLGSSSFWKLFPKSGHEFLVTSSHSIRSMNGLVDALDFVQLDPELFTLLRDGVGSAILQESLLNRYFPGTKPAELEGVGRGIVEDISSEILNATSEEYRARMESLLGSLPKEEAEEELFVRGGVFKREVPRLYGFQCAISGMQVETTTQAQLIDACHIIPFSVSKNDTVTNGISLCPNLHRAFDRGLIGITPEYRVLVSKALSERESPFSIRQFEGARIHLPDSSRFHPAGESLRWHLDRRFIWR